MSICRLQGCCSWADPAREEPLGAVGVSHIMDVLFGFEINAENVPAAPVEETWCIF